MLTRDALVNPGLRYLRAVFHSAPETKGSSSWERRGLSEAESSERETRNKRLRVAFIYLFIYQEVRVSGEGLPGHCGEGR